MFCIKCGKKAIEGEVLCTEHFLEGKPLFDIKDLTIVMCECGNYEKVGGRQWLNNSKEEVEVVKREIRDNVISDHKVRIDISFRKRGTEYLVKIIGKGTIPPCKTEKTEEKNILVRVKKRLCPNCVKIKGNYHEAVIQIRGVNQEKILKKLDSMVKQEGITKIKELENGYDMLLIDKAVAKKVCKQLKPAYEVKESFRLAATKKDKKLYRNYYSVR